jgi:MerR family mercuric resistance operon transcriptional regulator
MHIGQLAKRSGTKVETIRYYEKEGLLPEPVRELSGYRKYAERDLQRLTFISRGRALGFGLADIRDLMALEENPNLSCDDADRIARHHREQVRAKIAQLRGLERVLEQLVSDCHGGRRADCVILQALHQRAPPA